MVVQRRVGARRAMKGVKGLYRGYMPEGLPQHRKPNRIKPWWKVIGKPRHDVYPRETITGYSETPEYPPLSDDRGRHGFRRQLRMDWYKSLKAIPTAEEKLLEIDKHARHYVANFNNWIPNYNSQPLVQYMTRTHHIKSLPERYKVSKTSEEGENDSQAQEKRSKTVETIKAMLLGQIASTKYQYKRKDSVFTVRSIRDRNQDPQGSNRFLQNLLTGPKSLVAAESNPDLLDYQVDLSPAVRSWWYHSGFEPPNNKVFYKSRKDEDGRINQMIQVDGSSAFNFRCKDSMEPILAQDDPLVTDTSLVKEYCHPLREFDAKFKYKWPITLPGYWPTTNINHYDFPHTCFLTTDCLRTRQTPHAKVSVKLTDHEDCLNSQAILSAFSWLNGLSAYHGYTVFQEIDYPFTCQLITTDGQNWIFHVYQMNSHAFHRDLGGPQKNNIVWSSDMMKLYENYENGEFKGVSDEVVELLIKFLSQRADSEYTSQLHLRPFLGEDFRTDEQKEEQRKELKKYFHNRYNRYDSELWNVPLYEHIFFKSPVGRHRITHMKPRWHPPQPLYPRIFD